MRFSMRLTAIAALLSMGGTAYAALPVSGAIPAGQMLFSDDSAEQWTDVDGDGVLSSGDRLQGIFSIGNTAPPAVPLGAGTPFNELTGIFSVLVDVVTPTLNPALSNYTFRADPAFALANAVAAGTVGIWFEDSARDFARQACGGLNDIATCTLTASGGVRWATFGIAGAGFWTAANAQNDPSVGATLPLGTPMGTFGIGFDFMPTVGITEGNQTGFQWNKVSCFDTVGNALSVVDFCGQGGILATGSNFAGQMTPTPFEIFNNVDFTANRAVPEPGTLALIGLALAGLGIARRGKSSK